jgi:hypothetical protein
LVWYSGDWAGRCAEVGVVPIPTVRVDPRTPRSPTNFVVVQHATHRETSGGLRPASSNFAKLQTQTTESGRDLCIHAPVNNLRLLLEQKRHPREQHLRACFTAREAARRRSKAEQGPHLWGGVQILMYSLVVLEQSTKVSSLQLPSWLISQRRTPLHSRALCRP